MLRNLLIALTVLTTATQTTFSAPHITPKEMENATAYILVDAASHRVLTEHNVDQRLAPASITKLMTAYVVYQALASGKLQEDTVTTVSKKARAQGGSRMFLELGSKVTIDQLLHGLVIQSGNDAAIALAEAVSGTVDEFVVLMNRAAQSLGLENSQFKNPTGLPMQGHYMSAKDIATLAQAIITQYPKHYALYKQKSFTWNKIKQDNRNALLFTDSSVDGLKTGHTKEAGYCLAASAKNDNMRLVSVVLGTQSKGARARASKAMLAYGFDNFKPKTFFKAGDKVATANVENGDKESVPVTVKSALSLPIASFDKGKLTAKFVPLKTLVAPIDKGQVVGTIVIKQDGHVISKQTALAMEAVDESGFFSRLWDSIF